MPDCSSYSNLPLFETIMKPVSSLGIANITISWLDEYPKVVARLRRADIVSESPSEEAKKRDLALLLNIAEKYGGKLHGCCEGVMERSRCIDGALLSTLHPRGIACSTRKAAGQRELCGCTESYDIGSYRLCPNGCLYCYANPRMD